MCEVTPAAAPIQNDTWATLEYVDQGSGKCVVVTNKACYGSWAADATIWKKTDETDYETETDCAAANGKWKFNGQTYPDEPFDKSPASGTIPYAQTIQDAQRVCNEDPTCFGLWRDDVAQVWKAYCSEKGDLCTTAGDANANSLIGGLHGQGDLQIMITAASKKYYSPTRFYSCMTKL